jgi:hypothetical protein
MILPTICEKCGFGPEHECERSVCCCKCHVPDVRPERDLKLLAFIKASVAELDWVA